MTIAFWCIFAAFLLPYLFTIAAKAANPSFNNTTPREYLEGLTGWRKRAHWVQLNSFEIFAPFASAIIIATFLNVNQQWIDGLALLFVISRIIYGFCYISNQATLRTVVWLVGFGTVITLFIVAA